MRIYVAGHSPRSAGLRVTALLAMAVAAGAPTALAGSEPSAAPPVADTVLVPSTPLESAAVAFARALSNPSGDVLAALLVPSGIRLQLGGTDHGGLSARQASASLREFLHQYEAGSAVVGRAVPVDGSPVGGFAEVLWSGRMPGTSQAIRRTLFVGFVMQGETWRVDEVRLLP